MKNSYLCSTSKWQEIDEQGIVEEGQNLVITLYALSSEVFVTCLKTALRETGYWIGCKLKINKVPRLVQQFSNYN
jgi:hypothetical protein